MMLSGGVMMGELKQMQDFLLTSRLPLPLPPQPFLHMLTW
jgi:hypothetical protein